MWLHAPGATLYSPPLEMMRPWLPLVLAGLAATSWAQTGTAPPVLKEVSFDLPRDAEVIATIAASCEGCDWGRAGREAAVLRLSIDGAYSQHLSLARGVASADYPVML